MTNSKFYIDAGTTWSKILEIQPDGKRVYSVHKTAVARTFEHNYIKVTGHTTNKFAKNYENEVVALALGSKKYLEDDFVALDLGSRDIKWVKYKNSKFSDMDWNSSCASATGATIEMLLKFYDVKVEQLKFSQEKYPITCGIFGLEKIMDDVSKGLEPSVAISKFIHGIAFNAYNFTKNPKKICISGGFCENPCFIESLKNYCEVLPLGRFVLVDGLALQE